MSRPEISGCYARMLFLVSPSWGNHFEQQLEPAVSDYSRPFMAYSHHRCIGSIAILSNQRSCPSTYVSVAACRFGDSRLSN